MEFAGATASSREADAAIEFRQRPDTGKQRASLFLVALHLGDQGLQPVELLFLAQEAENGDLAGLAIEIVRKVEDEGFEKRRAVLVHGRAAAEARHPVMQAAVGAAQTRSEERRGGTDADVG